MRYLGKSLLCGLLTCIVAATSSGQTYIFGRADFPAGNNPVSVATGDFNGDGLIDLAFVSYDGNILTIVLGKPDGTFGAPVDYPTGPNPVSVAAGDFNRDGNLDLVVANENCVTVYEHGLTQVICGPGTVS